MSKLGALSLTKHTGPKHTATVIFFHGSGATGDHMKEWVSLMSKNFSFPHINIMYPTAPLQPYTPAGGQLSNVWFDRADVAPDVPEKIESLNNIEIAVRDLLKKEHDKGIPSSRIIFGGFSMGGALALHAGFRWDRQVAGVFAFSSFLNDNSVVYQGLKDANYEKLPALLQLHGDQDALVPVGWGERTRGALAAGGVRVTHHLLPRLGHALNQKGMHIIRDWIDQLLPPTEQ